METIGLRRLCREPSSADRCRHRGHSLIVPGQMCSCPSWSRSSALALLLSEITAAQPSASLLLVNTPLLRSTGDILRTVHGTIIVKNGKKIRISMRRHAHRCARAQMQARRGRRPRTPLGSCHVRLSGCCHPPSEETSPHLEAGRSLLIDGLAVLQDFPRPL